MPSSHSARLNLPYVAAGQLQKHVTVNEALARLDALTQTSVQSRTTAAQPADPTEGDLYILPAGATGSQWSAWSAGDLVRAEIGGWVRVPIPLGVLGIDYDAGELIMKGADGWETVIGLRGEHQNLTRLGLNTTADATNPFAAKVNKALWTARPTADGGDGDLRLTFNKDAPTDVLSLLFQSGYGGRAELGLIGDDDLSLKVSGDGAAWTEALRIDPDEGRVWFGKGAARCEAVLLFASADYVPPAWARTLAVTAVGGGGGGGTGAFGASGDRFGGGGGGGGGLSRALLRTADLAGTLSVVIGAGGASGSDAGDTTLSSGAALLLTAKGGAAGGSGAGGGLGGSGGRGTEGGNAGGVSSTVATSAPGASLDRAASPGGGGAGGGLDAGGTARQGGSGGVGGVLACPAPAGGGGTTGAGGVGSAPALPVSISGGGGGGGAAVAGAGAAGGVGGAYGAGGGGGGAGVSSGGLGGAGAGGAVLILVQG